MKYRFIHRIFTFLLLGVFFLCGHSSNLMALDLTKGHSEKIKLGKHLDILEDKLGELSFDDILKGNHKQKFIRAKTDTPNKRFTKSVFWLRFKLSQKQVPLPSYYLVFAFAGTDNGSGSREGKRFFPLRRKLSFKPQ